MQSSLQSRIIFIKNLKEIQCTGKKTNEIWEHGQHPNGKVNKPARTKEESNFSKIIAIVRVVVEAVITYQL